MIISSNEVPACFILFFHLKWLETLGKVQETSV